MSLIKTKSVCALLLLMALTGCATMSKDECLHADWYLKGLDDAGQGYAVNRVTEHAKACARVKIKPLVSEYESGHKKGARLYCVPEKGYSVGREGAEYRGICPADLELQFVRAYRDGQELYTIQHNIDNLGAEFDNNQANIGSTFNEIDRLKYRIVDSNSNSNDRENSLREIDKLQRHIRDLEIRNDHIAHELELFRHDFRIVEDKHVRMGYIK